MEFAATAPARVAVSNVVLAACAQTTLKAKTPKMYAATSLATAADRAPWRVTRHPFAQIPSAVRTPCAIPTAEDAHRNWRMGPHVVFPETRVYVLRASASMASAAKMPAWVHVPRATALFQANVCQLRWVKTRKMSVVNSPVAAIVLVPLLVNRAHRAARPLVRVAPLVLS
jgi:hypothetical protein